MNWSRIALAAVFLCIFASAAPAEQASAYSDIEHGLEIAPPNAPAVRLDLKDALRSLNIPSVSVALIEADKVSWAHAWGNASAQTLYQAASFSKLVTAFAALRLVEQGRLSLDRDVNEELTGWRVPASVLTRGHPVTLRGLLSMTAGIDVPGYLGYEPGTSLPNLEEVLDGKPPANSAPVRAVSAPGSRYAYSGGGYEIVQALVEAKTGESFADALRDLVFRPLGMADSTFAQPSSWGARRACGTRALRRRPRIARRLAGDARACRRRDVEQPLGSRQAPDRNLAGLSRG
jgi:CubicO group peptidase (beta-lactamase class C family)